MVAVVTDCKIVLPTRRKLRPHRRVFTLLVAAHCHSPAQTPAETREIEPPTPALQIGEERTASPSPAVALTDRANRNTLRGTTLSTTGILQRLRNPPAWSVPERQPELVRCMHKVGREHSAGLRNGLRISDSFLRPSGHD